MANQLDRLIDAARNQLPKAFSVTESPPWPEQPNEVVAYKPIVLPKDVEPDISSPFGEQIVEGPELEELKEELKEGGVEAIALYLSFHQPLLSGKWGIFLLGEPMWLLREKIRRDLGASRIQADFLAQNLVLSHEFYHFRLDLYALHQELVLRKPLYLQYVDSVYRLVVCTPECYEESLANCAALETSRNLVQRSSSVLFRNIIPSWPSYVRNFCEAQPPGYRDFGRPKTKLREGIGGQLHFRQARKSLAQPQAQWVGISPLRSSECPTYLVQRTPASQRGIRLRVKLSGDIWVCHRYDRDPFPSRPHAHNQQTGQKLHLGTGDIFDPHSRQPRGKVRDKILLQIRDDISQKWPDVMLPSIPS
jgi:hypothetical protein